MNINNRGQVNPQTIILVGVFLLILIFGVYAISGGKIGGVDKSNVERSKVYDKETDTYKVKMCKNEPLLEEERKLKYVYVKGRFGGDPLVPFAVEALSPKAAKIIIDDIIISETKLSKEGLAIYKITSDLRGRLTLTEHVILEDLGYRGEVTMFDLNKKAWVLEFSNVASNWNCENYASAGDKYRPQGASYKLTITWVDTVAKEIVDKHEQIVYVKY